MRLPAAIEAAIVEHARRDVPNECCGLLIGDADGIVACVPAANIADAPATRYRIEPRDHLAAIRAARERGLDVIGAYHSHPRSAARPSATDAAEAFAGFVFVLVGLASATAEITAWRWDRGNFIPIPLVRSPEG